MKKKAKIINKLFIIIISSTFLATGCNKDTSVPIVTINNKNLYLEDFLYDIYKVEAEGNQYEVYYQENLGYSYWNYDYNGTTMRDIAKNSILASVVMYEILSDQASKKGISLTHTELSDDDTEIDDIINAASEDELNSIGLTREVLKKSINKITLGDKYRTKLLKGYKIDEAAIRESINQADYREYKTECVFIPTVKTENKALVALNKMEIDSAYATITEAYKKLSTGDDFDCILNDYPNLDYEARDFIINDDLYEKEYQDAAILLNNGEYSSIVTTDYGYYLIYMIDNNSTDKYQEAIDDKVKSKEEKQFSILYNKLKAQYDITINFDYWDTITIDSITQFHLQ